MSVKINSSNVRIILAGGLISMSITAVGMLLCGLAVAFFSRLIQFDTMGNFAGTASVVGGILIAAGSAWMMSGVVTRAIKRSTNSAQLLAVLVMVGFMALMAFPAFAQTAEPAIDIPTDVIFSESNFWIETFAPIAAIGIGITIALAVLGYIGKMIANAFK